WLEADAEIERPDVAGRSASWRIGHRLPQLRREPHLIHDHLQRAERETDRAGELDREAGGAEPDGDLDLWNLQRAQYQVQYDAALELRAASELDAVAHADVDAEIGLDDDRVARQHAREEAVAVAALDREQRIGHVDGAGEVRRRTDVERDRHRDAS